MTAQEVTAWVGTRSDNAATQAAEILTKLRA